MSEGFARKVVGSIMAAADLAPVNRLMTWAQWSEFWLERCKATVAKKTAEAYKSNFKHVSAFLRAKKMDRVSLLLLTETHMQGLWEYLRGTVGLSYGGAGVVFAVLRSSFNYAVEAGYMERNPAKLIQKTGDKVAGQRDALTVAEVGKVLACADAEWRRLTLLGLCTGLRLMDCVRLTWANIETSHGVQVINTIPGKTVKTGKRVIVPITGPLADDLALTPAKRREGPLVPEIATISQVVISKRYSELLARAGVVGKRMPGKHGKFSKSFHSLRHTLTTWMQTAGVDKETRMRITGHSSAAVHDGYTHVQVDTLQKALVAGLSGLRK